MEQMSIDEILACFDKLYPNSRCELNHKNAYEMAVAVILSAQTTDVSVNRVTPSLFEAYPDAQSLAVANTEDIEKLIASLGLYHNKARSIQGFAREICDRFDGNVPADMKDLVSLPGVGRKCANVIMAECHGIPALAVDTHVARVARRLRLCYEKDTVDAIEKKLCRKIPREKWIKTHHQMIFFGRYLCHARNPECVRCPFVKICREKEKKQGIREKPVII